MCEKHQHDHTHPVTTDQGGNAHGHIAETNAITGETAECPVMPGSFVNQTEAEDEGLVREYQGKKYYLCCDDCGPMWDADPARYAQPA